MVSGVVPSSWILYGGDITVTMVATALGVLPSSISRLTVNAQRGLAQLGTVLILTCTPLYGVLDEESGSFFADLSTSRV